MLEFEKNYFKDEERDGFVVNELAKRNFAANLQMFSDVIDICERHGITYYIFYGSLIGAIRHKGIIPWDDDIDIMMKRDDYIRFLDVADMELDKSVYRIFNIYNRPDWRYHFTQIASIKEVDTSNEYLDRWHNFPFLVTLDIFPFYCIPRNEVLAEEQLTYVKAAWEMMEYAAALEDVENNSENAELRKAIDEGIDQLNSIISYDFKGDETLFMKAGIVYDRICRMYPEEDSDYYTSFLQYSQNGYKVEKWKLEKSIRLPFENIEVNAPAEYDTLLRQIFGDYMIPVKYSAVHEYPGYKEAAYALSTMLERMDIENKQKKNAGKCAEEMQNKTAGKKIFLYATTIGEYMLHSERVTEKIEQVIDLVKSNDDLFLWWIPLGVCESQRFFFDRVVPDFMVRYDKIMEKFRNDENILLDESGNIESAISMSTCFYGDRGIVETAYRETGKPMMIQNYEILG
ncbi:MAG: LicD family protein [Lachnospiraceae bacterium]|nr:LicD family protein [Lachnospiraceae bacterium]